MASAGSSKSHFETIAEAVLTPHQKTRTDCLGFLTGNLASNRDIPERFDAFTAPAHTVVTRDSRFLA